ncbi:hypothetical protein ABWL39_18730, partial [Chitinivorax sp. PXF-14]|uniref:hypothetical protein n=1 Tax=Chitinivorax sp. PXF-14 TaxID=3230488 RepID=UPI003466B147
TEIERKLGYDMYGLTHGNPDVTASKPFNPADSWGDKYVLDRDLAMGKIIANGWLTPDENAQLAQWNPRTGWLDTAAGRKLSVEEKEQLIAMLQSDAGPGVAQLAKMGS